MQKKPIMAAGAIAFEKTPLALRYKGIVSFAAIFVSVVLLVAMPLMGVINDSRIIFGGLLFMLTGGALFKFWADRTGKELPLRQITQWKLHMQNPPREMQDPSNPFSKAYFLDVLRAYPVESVGFFKEDRFRQDWNREGISEAIVSMAKKHAFNENGKTVDVRFVEHFISCLRSLQKRFPSGEGEKIRSDFIHEIAEWIAFDPKNWNFGKDLRKALRNPSLACGGEDEARLFPAFAASFFVSRTPHEFVSTLRVLSEDGRDPDGVMGMAELAVAKMFFGLLYNAPEISGFAPSDTVRFERLFVASQSWWKPRQIEQAVEVCLTGRFGPEIAKFAVPFVNYGDLSKPKSQTTPLGMIRGTGEATLARRFLRSDGFHPDAVARASVIFYDLGETSDVAREFAGVSVMPSPEGKKRK